MAHRGQDMLTSDLAFRGAVLALSALAHLLFYGALSLAPAWPPPPRMGLIVTELIAAEPPAPPVVRQPVTPPRPRVKPKPQARPVETIAPQTTPRGESRVEPQIERDIASPPIEAAAVVSSETPRDVSEAPASTIASTPTGSPPAPVVSSTEASGPATLTSSRSGSAAVVAALSPAAAVSAVTRTAIPRGGYQVTPSYPASARRLGIEGTALLRVFVDAKGHVGDVVVKQSAGHPDLDRAAADAVRRWRFDPARQGADAVAMWVELPVEFHLR
jgi:periplasmic protein TonB